MFDSGEVGAIGASGDIGDIDELLSDPELVAMLACDDAQRALVEPDDQPVRLLDQIDLLTLLERQKAALEAAQIGLLAAIDAADRSERGWAQESVMCALHLSGHAAKHRLTAASTLSEELPATLAELRAGRSRPGTPRSSPKRPGS